MLLGSAYIHLFILSYDQHNIASARNIRKRSQFQLNLKLETGSNKSRNICELTKGQAKLNKSR